MSRINTLNVVFFDPGTEGSIKLLGVFTRRSAADAYAMAHDLPLTVWRTSLIRETREELAQGSENRSLVSRDKLNTVTVLVGEIEDYETEAFVFVDSDAAKDSIPGLERNWRAEEVEGHIKFTIFKDVPLLRVSADEAEAMAETDSEKRAAL